MVQHSSSQLAGARATIVETVVEAYLRRLRAEGSFLVRDPRVAGELARQVEHVLGEVLAQSRAEERQRIARDLHDRLGHNLALAMQHLDLHRHYAERNPEAARAKLDHALAALGEATRMVQHIAADLRRSMSHDGIERALRSYLRANVPAPIRATLEVIGDASALPTNVADEIYLIMCEAIRNAVRHADSGELRLMMTVTDGLVEASVTDGGRGFEPTSNAHSPGGGLPSMLERAELLDGTLRVTSRPGGGTTVALRVPLSESGR